MFGKCNNVMWNKHSQIQLLSVTQTYILAVQAQELSQEDAHYSETVTTILRHNSSRGDESKSNDYFVPSRQTAFAGWNSTRDHPQIVLSEGTSQWLLKTMLFRVPTLHCRYKDENSPPSIEGEGGGSRSRKGAAQEEPSANHVLAERRRREKLNERFIVLRSLVPFVTKVHVLIAVCNIS